VKEQLVGRNRVPTRIVAGEVHQMLRQLTHKPALLRRRQGRIPEPVVEILIRGELSRSTAEGHDLAQDGGHATAGRDCSLQVCRDIDLWDAVQSVDEAGIGRDAGVH
jgi:hypothetical protein